MRNEVQRRERDESYLQERMMRDLHKQRIYERIDKDRQRHIDEVDKITRQIEAKKLIQAEFKNRFASNQVTILAG